MAGDELQVHMHGDLAFCKDPCFLLHHSCLNCRYIFVQNFMDVFLYKHAVITVLKMNLFCLKHKPNGKKLFFGYHLYFLGNLC